MRDKNAPKWKVSSWVSGNVGSNGCLSERECVRLGVCVVKTQGKRVCEYV